MKIRLLILKIFIFSALFYCQGYPSVQDTTWTTYTTADGLVHNNISSIVIDLEGNMWFGTSGSGLGGVSKFDGNEWTNYTTADGLAHNYITSIAIDSMGNKWFGTYGGVSKFDGTNWTTYTTANGLASNIVYSVAIDSKGNKWFGTYPLSGVSKFDGTNWTTYLEGKLVSAITEDSQGNIWFGTSGGATKFDGTNWTTYTTADGLAHNGVMSIAQDLEGNMWFGTSGGGEVSRFDGTNWTTYTETGDNAVSAIAIDSTGNIWFGTWINGVSRFDGTNWNKYTTVDGLAQNSCEAIAIDREGNKWFGTSGGGVNVLVGNPEEPEINLSTTSVSIGDVTVDSAGTGTFTISNIGNADLVVSNITSDNGLFAISPTSATIADGDSQLVTITFNPFEDGSRIATITITSDDSDESTLLIDVSGYGRKGISFINYTTADGLVHNTISAIAIDAENNKWFGTWGGGISKFDGTNWTNYTTEDGLAGNAVTSIAIDAEGYKWFGTTLGVSKFDGTNWINYTTADGLLNSNVEALAIDSEGNKWFGIGGGGGVFRFDGTNWTKYTTEDGLAQNSCGAISIDREGNKWFGTAGGVSKFDGANWTTYTTADGLAESTNVFSLLNYVSAIAIDAEGNKWFGTWGGGVSKFDGTNWTSYTTADGLAHSYIYSIAIDAEGKKWFGTNGGGGGEAGGGVSIFDDSSWTTYDTTNGLASNSVQAIAIDSSGNMWFGTTKGVSMLGIGTGGQSSEPEIAISNDSVSIDDVAIDNSGTGTFTIYNQGNADLAVSNISSDNGVFTVSPTSATIAAGDSLLVTVAFSPISSGSQNAAITISSNDSDESTLVINASGIGTVIPIPLTLIDIPGGIFQMGQEGVAEPVHLVTVSTFKMSANEITNSQFAEYLNTALTAGEITATENSVTGAIGDYNGQLYIDLSGSYDLNNQCWISYDGTSFSVEAGKENWPVVFVTWYGAKAFAEKNGFDLPREAEWEYASKAGLNYEYGTDDGTLNSSIANYGGNIGYPVDVGSYPANPFGLYDMAGNIWEWCNDYYATYESESATDPLGPTIGTTRIGRSGSWSNAGGDSGVYCRSASRNNFTPISNGSSIGFRVVKRETVYTPEINLSTTSVSIGDVTVDSSGTGTFTISNTGNADLVVSSITSDNEIFSVSIDSTTIAVGDSQNVIVTFSPIAADSQSATISITSNDNDEANITISVSGIGVLPSYTLEGNVKIDTSGFSGVSLHLTGNGVDTTLISLNDGSYFLSGITDGVYIIKPVKEGYSFSPDSLIATISGADTSLPDILATLLAPEISIDTTIIDFGSVHVDSSANRSFTISNTGTADLEIDSILSNNTVFTIDTTSALILPGDSMIVTVTFSPIAADSQSAMITVFSNDIDEGMLTFIVSGSGLETLPIPVLHHLKPDSIPQGATDTVLLYGQNLNKSSRIVFEPSGLMLKSIISSSSSDSILALGIEAEDYALEGLYTLILISPAGDSASLDSALKVITGPPVIDSLSVSNFHPGDSLEVIAWGRRFQQDMQIDFGDSNIEVKESNWVSAGEMRFTVVVSWEANEGQNDIILVTPDGDNYVGYESFSLIAYSTPQFISVIPDNVDQDAGSFELMLTGADFSSLFIGRIEGDGLVLDSTIFIDSATVKYFITSDSSFFGFPNLVLINPDGKSAESQDLFEIIPVPIVTSISPDTLSQGDTATVLIEGFSLDNGLQVSIIDGNGVNLINYEVDQGLLNLHLDVSSEAPTGWRGIQLTHPNGKTRSIEQGVYIKGGIALISVSIETIEAGSDSVSLIVQGQGFTIQDSLYFTGDGIIVRQKEWISPTQFNLIIDVDEGTLQDYHNLILSDGIGNEKAILENAILVVKGVALISASPSQLVQGTRGVVLHLLGNGFDETAIAKIYGEGVLVVSTTFVSADSLRLIVDVADNALPGIRDVEVILGDSRSAFGQGLIKVVKNLRLVAVEPSKLYRGMESLPFRITGEGIDSGATVSFIPSTGITYDSLEYSSRQITGLISVSENSSVGLRDIQVTNLTGVTDLLESAVEVVAPPVVDASDPNELYQETSNVNIEITGENFEDGAIVSISGIGLIVYRTDFIDESTLSVTLDVAMNAPTGSRDVRVVNPGGAVGIGKGLLLIKQRARIFDVRPYYIYPGSDSLYLAINGSGFTEDAQISFSGSGIGILENEYNGVNQLLALVNVAADALPGRRDLTLTVNDLDITHPDAVEIKQNDPPEITVIGEWIATEGEMLAFVVRGIDPEGDPLTFSAGELPEGASFHGRAFTWKPGYDQEGVYSVEFTAMDRLGAASSATVNIIVENKNRPPKIKALTNHQSNVGESMVFNLVASDPDQDVLNITSAGLPAGAELQRFSDSSFTFNWTPEEADIGTFRTSFTISDPYGGIDRRSMAMTVRSLGRDINLPPEFTEIPSLSVAEGEHLEFVMEAVDPEEDEVVVFTGALPFNADFDPVTGKFTFDPDYTQAGEYSFLFVASDGKISASHVVNVTVVESNVPPVIYSLHDMEVAEGSMLNFRVVAVDSGGENISYSAEGLPRGAYLDPESGNFIFIPDYNQAGSYPVTFTVTDESNLSAEEEITITVLQTNQPPMLGFIPNQFVQTGSQLEFQVTAIDPDGDDLTFEFYSEDLQADLFNAENQVFTYDAEITAGYHELQFVVSDESGSADSQNVVVVVTEGDNEPPVIDELSDYYYQEGETASIEIIASDPEGSALSYTIANSDNLPESMRNISQDGLYEFSIDYSMSGSYEVIIEVSDGELSATQVLEINIVNVNIQPEIAQVADQSVSEGEEIEIQFAGNDPDGDVLSYELSFIPRGAYFDGNAGLLRFKPDYDQADSLLLTVTASDGILSASSEFNLIVENTNRAPKVRRVKDPEVEQGGLIEFEIEADDPDDDSTWVVIDTTLTPFLTGSLRGSAMIRNGRSFIFDTEKLIDGLRIPSAVLTFYAVDEHGAESDREIVDIAVIRKAFESVRDLPPGLAKKLDWDNVGVQIAIQNNSDSNVSWDVNVEEKSGKLNKGNGSGNGNGSNLLASWVGEEKVGKERYSNVYLSGIEDYMEQVFYGIRRGWGLDLTAMPDVDLTMTLQYFDSDIPDDVEGLDEDNLSVFGLDSETGQFVLIEGAVINPDSNTATFTLSNPNITEYTLGTTLAADAGSAAGVITMSTELQIGELVLEGESTTNTEGPYTVRITAPENALVTDAVLFYRSDSLSSYQVTSLQKVTGEINTYSGDIPGLAGGGLIQYYARMTVNYENLSVPSNPITSPYEIKVIKLDIMPGDVMQDGSVNVFDLLELLNVLSGQVDESQASDVNGDGATNVFDLLEILTILSQ